MKKINRKGKKILVTGTPGLIGTDLVISIIKETSEGIIVILDNMNDFQWH